MGAEDNGLTLERLAQRLETLERENTELRSKVATLEGSGPSGRDEIAENRGSDKQRSGEAALLASDGQVVSRRALLGKAGATAVAAMAAGTLLYPREANANHYDTSIEVDTVETHYVLAYGGVSAEGTSDNVAAVSGKNSAAGPGVRGLNEGGTGPGVHGQNNVGTGVLGQGKIGILGQTGTTDHGAVYGEHTGTDGYGVVGDGKGTGAGVLGRNSSTNVGIGVKGQGNIIGLKGESTNGYGGHFQGAKAQVKLLPNPKVGRPTTGGHQQGELFLDSTATLFICTASGTPGTWSRVRTVAV